MAEAAPPQVIFGPVKVQGGTRVELLDRGVRLTTRTGMFSKPDVQMFAWEDFKRCDVETFCCKGKITLGQVDGDSLSFTVWAWKARALATTIYKNINMGRHGRVDPEVTHLLGHRPPALFFDSGLVLVKKQGCCAKASSFVPYEAVVSLSLSSGCCKSSITVKTLLEKPPEYWADLSRAWRATTKGPTEDWPGSPMAITNKWVPAKNLDQKGDGNLEVRFSGKAAAMEQVFVMLVRLINGGEEPQPLANAPEMLRTTLTTLGLCTTQRNVKHMLPWNSIAEVDIETSYFGRSTLELTDCTGEVMPLSSVKQEDFDAIREQISKAKGIACTDVKPIVRRNIRLTEDGLSLTTRHLCSADNRFIPWNQLDLLEMEVRCCGGNLTLVTEDGQRIQVFRAGMFGGKRMNELAKRIQEMKYGQEQHGYARPRSFAGREGGRTTSRLTNSSIRLVAKRGSCARVMRVLDLDSIDRCEAAGATKLLVWVRKTMHISDKPELEGQPLEVHLLRGDDVHDITADIMQRACARKQMEA